MRIKLTVLLTFVAVAAIMAGIWQPAPALAVRESSGWLSAGVRQPYQIGSEITSMRDRTTKVYYRGANSYSAAYSMVSVHYEDEYGDWHDIDTTIVASARPNWDYEVTKGSWTLLIAANTTVAIGKNGHWIGFRYAGYGYLDWATKAYVVLGTANSVTPVVTANSITWPDLFAGVDLEYVYTPDGFKENLYVSQTARDWLAAHPPSSYGLNNPSSYLVGGLECDWQDALPAERYDGTPINWDNVNEFISTGAYFRDPVLNQIVEALPLGYARHDGLDAGNWTQLRYRFYEDSGTHYLLFGAGVTELNSYPSGTINLDPSLNLQVGASTDDGWEDNDGTVSLTNWYNQWSAEYTSSHEHLGQRWTSGSFPASGSTIISANISTYCRSTTYDDPYGKIYLQDGTASPPTFTTASYAISSRTHTTAYTSWVEDGVGEGWQTVNITSAVQEVIDNYSPTAIVVIWDTNTYQSPTKAYSPYHYDYGSGYAAKLDLAWASGCSPSVGNSPSTWSVNSGDPVDTSSTYNTGLGYFNVTNNSGGAVSISISAGNMTGGGYTWVLSDTATAGNMIYGLKAGLNGGSYNVTVKQTAPYNDLVASLADSTSQLWGLQIYTPTVYSDGNSKSGTVALTAACL